MEGKCGIHAINITICQNSTKERSHRYHYSWLHYKLVIIIDTFTVNRLYLAV